MGFLVTETIVANGIPKSVKFLLDKDMRRNGIFQFTNSKNVTVVIVVSRATGNDPVGKIDRWNKNLKRRCHVQVPAVVENNNAFMICVSKW